MIRIDTREARAHPLIAQQLSVKIGAQTEQFDFADYVFSAGFDDPSLGRPATIGIELSSISDFVGKIDSDRFGFQMVGLIERYDIPVMLIGGPLQKHSEGHVLMPGSPAHISFDRANAALFAAASHGVIVHHAPNNQPEAVATTIQQMYTYWQKPPAEHKMFRRFNIKYRPTAKMPLGIPLDPRIQTLMTFPLVGEDRATNAILTHGSLFTIFTASFDQLKKTPGWGARTAKDFRDYIMDGIGSSND